MLDKQKTPELDTQPMACLLGHSFPLTLSLVLKLNMQQKTQQNIF